MRTFKKQDELTITSKLRLGAGASVLSVNKDGTESYGGKVRTLSSASTLKAQDSGSTLVLNSATEFATTLPAPKAGLELTFIVGAAPSGASYTIVSNDSANVIRGLVLSADLNAASDGDSEASGGDTITLVDSVAVVGDQVELISDGTYWYMKGFCAVFNAITITTAS